MKMQEKKWWSPSLGKEMKLLIYGHAGAPVVAFPSTLGKVNDWETFKMIESIEYQIAEGHNRLICVESVDEESFYNKQVEPYIRIMRHQQYEEYIIHEVMPLVHNLGGNVFTTLAGCGFGAFYALNFALKYPSYFVKVIAMSGLFDIRGFMDGFNDDAVYYNNPIEFMPNLTSEHLLTAIRQLDIRLIIGEHDSNWNGNQQMSSILNNKQIDHILDVWSNGTQHDWSYWREMVKKHIA